MKLPFKSADERRRLLGKDVLITMMSGRKRKAQVLRCSGRNIEIDEGGSRGWLYVTDIYTIEDMPA